MTRSTIAVLLIAGALGTYVALGPPSGAGAADAAHSDVPLVAAGEFPVDEMVRMTLGRRGEEPLVFEKTQDGWKQTKPFLCPMDQVSVRRLASAVVDLRVRDSSRSASGASLTPENVSLDPPLAEVTYEWPGRSLRLELGRRGLAGMAYLRVKGQQDISVVNQSLHERALGMDPKDWRDRSVFHNIGPEADRIQRQDSPTAALVLVRDRRTWKMLEPVATRVDQAVLSEYIDALGRVQFAGVMIDQAPSLEQFGLSPAQATLSITGSPPGSAATVQTLLIGAKCVATAQDRFAMQSELPVVWRIAPQPLAALFRPAKDFIDPTAAGVNPADVKRVVLRTGDSQVVLERDLDSWIAPDHADAVVDVALVNDLLGQLTSLRASAIDLRDYPRDQEIATITLHGFDLKAITTVRLARNPSDNTLLMENGDNVLRVYPASVQLPLNAEAFGLTPGS